MYIFNNLKDFFKMSKIFYGFGVLSWLMVMVGCSPVEPNQGPVVREVAKIFANDSDNYDRFGHSVSIDGNTVIVGAVRENAFNGSAYIFTRDNGNNWSQQAKIKATIGGGGVSTFFGWSVSLDSDYAVVGARGYYFPHAVDGRGSVYIFFRNGSNWLQQKEIQLGIDDFGISVAINGSTVIVGSPDEGAAYIYVRNGTNWTQQARLTISDVTLQHYFGRSVALDGNTAVVGAVGDFDVVDGVRHPFRGSIYIFTRNGNSWSQQAEIKASDGVPGDRFGVSVAIEGDTVIVGADGEGYDGNGSLTGAIYTFTRSGSTWTEEAKIKANDYYPQDGFGTSVAIDGDTILASAPYDDDNGSDSGSAYIFTRSGTNWTQLSKFLASDKDGVDDHFGRSVSLDGDNIVVGANEFYATNGTHVGSAYIFQMNK